MPGRRPSDLVVFRALRQPHIMHRLYLVLAMCCASFPCDSAPTVPGEDLGSQWKDKVEPDERLREEIDGQDNILSKVGDKHPFCATLMRKIVI